ncbi:MAG: 50S ribosomal protein L25 [Cyanothece sp. SIO2G6]|nr:50S ribosomal protein L25 [Cyanothece sp. SIO2G6]
MELTIEGKKREENTKAKALRREGLLPASLYGHDGANAVSLVLDAKEVSMLMRKVKVNDTQLELNVSDMPWSGPVVVKEAHKHPWRGYLYHLSFYSLGDKAQASESTPENAND